MSSSKQKKIHHERGGSSSKPSSSSQHKHHHSRDSAIGSSITTASDRASVGTAVDTEPLTASMTEDHRYNLRVVQEALDAANDRIKVLEATNKSLNESLAESHKENRKLKKEKSGLFRERDDLLGAIEDLNKRLGRDTSPRSMAAAAEARQERESRSSPSIRERRPEPPRQQQHHQAIYEEMAPLPSTRQPSSSSSSSRPAPISERDRRSSLYERHNPPSVPTPPVNHHPNPFLPRSTPAVTYSPAMVLPSSAGYSSSNAGYTTAPPTNVVPAYALSTSTMSSNSSNSSRRRDKNDGRYHLEPL